MVSEVEYGENRINCGAKGHFHDGVWWTSPFPGYAKPMFEYQMIVPRKARPAWAQSFVGYSHHVSCADQGNWSKKYLVLDGDSLAGFCLEKLPGKKRNQVRKSAKTLVVKRIKKFNSACDEIRDIYISQAKRHTANYDTPETPPEFYIDREEFWRDREKRYFCTSGRVEYGAYCEGRLVAFLAILHVDKTVVIEKMKSHTDSLNLCPSDALYYAVITDASADKDCDRIVNPGFRGKGLTRYKKQFLFEERDLPVFVSSRWPFVLARRIFREDGRHEF